MFGTFDLRDEIPESSLPAPLNVRCTRGRKRVPVVACGYHSGGAVRVMQSQQGLRALLRATRAVVEFEELPVVLEHITQAAVDLVDAEYGAPGVIATDRDG